MIKGGGPKSTSWIQKALDLGIHHGLWNHWISHLKYIWYRNFALLFLTSPIPHWAKSTSRPCFHGNPGCDSPLKSVNSAAGLSSHSKLLACFMPSLVPGFTQECVGWGDFIRTINNGGDIIRPSPLLSWQVKSSNIKGKQANGLEHDSVPKVQAEKGLWGAQSEKHRSPTRLGCALQNCRCLVGAGHCCQTDQGCLASPPAFCDRKKTLQIILLLLFMLCGRSMAQENFWHREHLQTPLPSG